MRKDSLINNFKKYQKKIYKNSLQAVIKSKFKNNIYHLNKKEFNKNTSKSFDYAVLEKTKNICAIKLNIPWSDLGSWKEILLMFFKNKKKYYEKKNIHHRPWGSYINLYNGRNFLIKELIVKPKGMLSLQKHFHRSEHWVITQGKPQITLNKKSLASFILLPKFKIPGCSFLSMFCNVLIIDCNILLFTAWPEVLDGTLPLSL